MTDVFILKFEIAIFPTPFCPFVLGRFGIGRFTTEEEVDYTAEKCIFHVSRLREMRSVQSHFYICPNRTVQFLICLFPSVLCGRWFKKASISRTSSGHSTRLSWKEYDSLWILQIDQLLSFPKHAQTPCLIWSLGLRVCRSSQMGKNMSQIKILICLYSFCCNCKHVSLCTSLICMCWLITYIYVALNLWSSF